MTIPIVWLDVYSNITGPHDASELDICALDIGAHDSSAQISKCFEIASFGYNNLRNH